jgi:predicted nucleotidyltransferase
MLDVMNNKKSGDIVLFLISNPSREFSQKEIMSKANVSKATMANAIPFLKDRGVISLRKIGVTNLIRINNDDFMVKEIKKIKIVSGLEELKKLKDVEIYLYGSCARGEYVEESDVDLLIIGNLGREEMVAQMQSLSKKIKRNISFKIFSDVEWVGMSKKDPSFYERVEKDKIRLL